MGEVVVSEQQVEEQWIPVAEASRQAREFVLGFLPADADEDHDCETCRVIRAIADGFLAPE